MIWIEVTYLCVCVDLGIGGGGAGGSSRGVAVPPSEGAASNTTAVNVDQLQLLHLLRRRQRTFTDDLDRVEGFSRRQRLIESLEEENAKRDKAIESIQTTLQDTETILLNSIFQSNQKLKSIYQAQSRKTSADEIIRFAHRISKTNAVAAPLTWKQGDPERPYPTDSEMRCGVLAKRPPPSGADGVPRPGGVVPQQVSASPRHVPNSPTAANLTQRHGVSPRAAIGGGANGGPGAAGGPQPGGGMDFFMTQSPSPHYHHQQQLLGSPPPQHSYPPGGTRPPPPMYPPGPPANSQAPPPYWSPGRYPSMPSAGGGPSPVLRRAGSMGGGAPLGASPYPPLGAGAPTLGGAGRGATPPLAQLGHASPRSVTPAAVQQRVRRPSGVSPRIGATSTSTPSQPQQQDVALMSSDSSSSDSSDSPPTES